MAHDDAAVSNKHDKPRGTSAVEGNLARLVGMVQAADTRLGFVFALNTAMLGVLAAFRSRALLDGYALTAGIIAAVLLVLSLICLSIATFPRTRGPADSLLFFQSIAKMSREDFLTAIRTQSHEAYFADLAGQCHRNSEIARDKFAWLQRSLALTYLGSPFWLYALLVLSGLPPETC